MRGASGERPPPILASWKAPWTRRAASAACSASTTKEMFSSDEPWAMAITFTAPAARAEKTRDAIPGVPAIPLPTTAITATPPREVIPSMRPAASSSLNARSRAFTARRASASGSVKPIELSDEAWKIVETERPSAWTAENVRAAMPGTPIIPFPATVTSDCPLTVARALTGYSSSVRRADTSVPGRSGSRKERTRSVIRLPSRGMSARGCSTLAPKYATSAASRWWSCGTRRASGTARGSAVRMPATSFQRTTRMAPSARASSVAVRSVPPRPSVVTPPSGPRPRKPGTTATAPRESSGRSRRRAFLRVSGMSGAACP